MISVTHRCDLFNSNKSINLQIFQVYGFVTIFQCPRDRRGVLLFYKISVNTQVRIAKQFFTHYFKFIVIISMIVTVAISIGIIIVIIIGISVSASTKSSSQWPVSLMSVYSIFVFNLPPKFNIIIMMIAIPTPCPCYVVLYFPHFNAFV